MKFLNFLKVFVLSAVLLAGCSSDDVYKYGENPYDYDHLSLPAIERGTFPDADIDMTVGESLTLSPRVVTPGDTYFTWYFNGEEVGYSSTFSYTAQQQMRDGVLLLELENDNGRVTLERKINVAGSGFAGKYLIINEGWYGHESGSLSAYDPQSGRFEHHALRLQNGGKQLGVTSQSATMWNGKLYICSKDGAALTVVDPHTLVIEKQIAGPIAAGRQAYEFIGLDEQYGIVTADANIYRVNLETMAVDAFGNGNLYQGVGNGIVFGGHLLLNPKSGKVNAIPLADLTGAALPNYTYTPATIDITTGGGCRFAEAADGNLYTIESKSGTNSLVRIKPDLSLEKTAIRSDYAPSAFSAYREAMFCGGADNSFFYVAGNKIYKCTFDEPAPTAEFCGLGSEYAAYSLYGAGIRLNPANGELVATYIDDTNTTTRKDNVVARFDGATGQLLSQHYYEGYWFPATIIFNN